MSGIWEGGAFVWSWLTVRAHPSGAGMVVVKFLARYGKVRSGISGSVEFPQSKLCGDRLSTNKMRKVRLLVLFKQ